MASIEESVYDRLSTASAVTDLLAGGTRGIYPEKAPSSADLPYITYSLSDVEPLQNLSGSPPTTQATVEVEAWADSYKTAKQIAVQTRARLGGWFDKTATPRIDGMLWKDETDRSEKIRDEEDELTYRITQEFSVWYC